MDDYDYDYQDEIDYYCPVCETRITRPSLDLPPPPPPPTSPPSNLPSPPLAQAPNHPQPSTSAVSRVSSNGAKMRRSASGGAHPSKPSGGLKRNKSSSKLPGHGTRRSNSSAALHALAPMTTATSTVGEGKRKATIAGGVGKAGGGGAAKGKAVAVKDEDAWEVTEEVVEDETASDLGMYCSEECRRIDEARNALQLAHLTGRPLVPPPLPRPPEATNRSHSAPFDHPPRRSSSGFSGGASQTAFTPAQDFASTTALSPIFSPSAILPEPRAGPFNGLSAYPFPSVAPPSASLPSFHHPPLHQAHASSSLPPPLSPSLSGGSEQHPPTLNFAARRKSRGAESFGSYAYRPSLTDRMASSDALYSLAESGPRTDGTEGGLRPATLGEKGRSYSSGPGTGLGLNGVADGGGARRLGDAHRTQSVDQLVGMGGHRPAHEREGRQARTPSALSGFRSMTPISNSPSTFSPSLPSAASNRSSSPAQTRSTLRGARRKVSRESHRSTGGEEEGEMGPPPAPRVGRRKEENKFFVGSAPSGRGVRGPSFDEPTLDEASSCRPLSLHRPQRSSSSASLALMGTSLGKSYHESSRPWMGGTKRTDSTASLSGVFAHGEMSSTSFLSSAAATPVSGSQTSTIPSFSPRNSSYRQPLPPLSAYSPSSTTSASSYSRGGSSTDLTSHSHHSQQSSSHYNPILSTSASSRSTHSSHYSSSGLRRSASTSTSRNRDRTSKGLHMTPSASSSHLPALGGASSPPPSSSALHHPANAATYNPSLSYLQTTTPSPAPSPPPSLVNAVPTYPAYDVDTFRSQSQTREGEDVGGTVRGGAGREGPRRKKLFYFS